MCVTCGCSEDHDHGHDHGHGHGHGEHDHHHHQDDLTHHRHHHDRYVESDHEHERRIVVEERVLGRNRLAAERNRGFFGGRRVLALNLVSSPGSGKTSLLERSIANEGIRRAWYVVQGDQATDRDAERVRRKGATAVQLNTGTVCHLDAAMVARAVATLDPKPGSIVAIENVGNLVCPALFDLGEQARVVVASTTEGSDKPIKYPYMFRSAELVVLNKMDLLPHVDFDVDHFTECVRGVNRDTPILALSATRGDGMSAWYRWLDERLRALAPIYAVAPRAERAGS
jgi:hydrogenase nickel incorporation protein HypB